MTYNNVKSIYPQFKNLTTHRKVMERFKTARWKVRVWEDKMGEETNGDLSLYLLMRELKIDTAWYVKSQKKQIMNRNSKKKNRVFEKILGSVKFGEDVMKVNYLTERNKCEFHEQQKMHLLFIKWEEDVAEYTAKNIKKYPFLYKDGELQEKRHAYADWVLYEMWMSAKKDAFYETMLERDGKGISLCDDVIGLINEYL
jgi:hypothetical protein